MTSSFPAPLLVLELTDEELNLLCDIRTRKNELAHEIRQLKCEIRNITSEISGSDNSSINSLNNGHDVQNYEKDIALNTQCHLKCLNESNQLKNQNLSQDDSCENSKKYSHDLKNSLHDSEILRTKATKFLSLNCKNFFNPISAFDEKIARQRNKEVQSLSENIKSFEKNLPNNEKLQVLHCAHLRAQGAHLFNEHPEKGLQFLIRQGILNSSAQEVAQYLFVCEGLSRKAIGLYIAQRRPFNVQVLHAFTKLHAFRKQNPLEALRAYLNSFLLPGESQQIQRLLEQFAEHYCAQNEGLFNNVDQCFLLAYSLLMLNTLLHNPQARDGLSKRRFMDMNAPLSKSLLGRLYEDVRCNPFRVPQDENRGILNGRVEKTGWLAKRPTFLSSLNWPKRWFALSDRCLYYFQRPGDQEPKGIIPLENVKVYSMHKRGRWYIDISSSVGTNHLVKLCKIQPTGPMLQVKQAHFRLAACSEEEAQTWISSIQQAISHNPYMNMLLIRRKKN